MSDQTSQQAADQIAFEKWYLQERKQTAVRSAISWHTEHYVSISVATEWEVWQAALKHAQQAVESERDKALHVAQVLVDKLEVIHQSPEYNAVWVLSANRGMPYKGPNYINELAALKSALKSQQPAQADKDKP